MWRFSNLRKLSTIHLTCSLALRKQLLTNLISGPPTGSEPFAAMRSQLPPRPLVISSYRSDTGHPDTKLRRVSGWRLNSPESRRSRKSNKRPTCSTPILCAAKTPAIDSDTNTDIAYLLVALIAAVVRHTRNKHLDKLNVLGPGDSITLRPKASPSPNFQTHNRPPPPPRGYAMAYHPNPPGLECLASNVAHGRI